MTEEAKKARLVFGLEHKDWLIEDWKNVIFPDKSSVVLGRVRGTGGAGGRRGEISQALCSMKMDGQEGVYVVELLFLGRKRAILHLGEGDSG